MSTGIYDVKEKEIKIDDQLRKWAEKCDKAIDYLTTDSGAPAKKIKPIKIKFGDGHEEQCGMSFGEKAENGKEVTFIVCDHTNELVPLHAVEFIRENYLKHAKALEGNRINIVIGGQPSQAKELLALLKDPGTASITEDTFETYRNTVFGANCNRIDVSNIPKTTSEPGSEAWHNELQKYFDSLESTPGSQGWLQQKHFALQKYTNKLDFHSFSRPGAPIIGVNGVTEENIREAKTVDFLRLMDVRSVLLSKDQDGSYMAMFESINPKDPQGNFLEIGAHRELSAESIVENASAGLVKHIFGFDMLPERGQRPQTPMTLCNDMQRIYPPASASAGRNPENFVPEMYLDGKRLAAPPQGGVWASKVYAISRSDALPFPIKEILKGEHIPTQGNGEPIKEGEPIMWTLYTLPDGTKIPAIFRSPCTGLTHMTPAKGWTEPNNPYYFIEISQRNEPLEAKDRKFTNGIPKPGGFTARENLSPPTTNTRAR